MRLGAGLAVAAAMLATPAAALDPAAAPGRFVEVSGGRLHVVVLEPKDGRAHGLPLVLLHGASGNLRDLELSIGRSLGERRRVVLIDRPGHGRSDRLGGRTMASPARQADAVAEALDRLGIGRAVVVGHSWSGALAANLALDHPSHVAALAFIAPATHPYEDPASWYNQIAATPLIGPVFAATVAGAVGRARFEDGVKSVFAPRDPPPDYVSRIDAMTLLRPTEFVANAEDLVDLRGFLRAQAPRYGAIRVPTVILADPKDTIVSTDIHARPLNRRIKGSRLVLLDGAGHMPHWTATATVVAEIERVAAKAR